MRATAAPALTSPPSDAATPGHLTRRDVSGLAVGTRCATCSLRELCLPCGLAGQDIVCLDELIYARKQLKRGQSIYRDGDPFHSLYAVRSGFFKSNLQLQDGREQVTGFHMTGEVMGMDGIDTGKHTSSAVALEDGEVCALSYAQLISLSRDVHTLLPRFHRMMSREIVREHGVMLLLGSRRADQRLAFFLLNLSQRFTARDHSPSEFNLGMSREEIGSYLGLKLETVSRMLSRFQCDGLIGVQQRQIRILDLAGLKRITGTALQ